MKIVQKTLAPLLLTVLMYVDPVVAQWIQQPFPSSENLLKVHFADSNNGWILGGRYVYRTTNGGSSWTPRDTVMTGGGRALWALNSNVVFFVEYPGSSSRGIRKTTDGGNTWRTVDTLRAIYWDIEFINSQIGYAACEVGNSANPCVIRKTTNGGETWNTVLALNAGGDFEAVSFIDPLRGWAISYSGGLVFRTTDGGTSWSFQDSVGLWNGTSFPMRDVKFTTADSGWAVGGIASTSVIARTTNGGVTWTKSGQGGNSLEEVAMVNSRIGWIVGRVYNVPPLHTTNGGETWIPQPTSPPIFAFDMFSISMVDENFGWIVGQGGRVYKTTNGGLVDVKEHTLPQQVQLYQNYPNPFNPSTEIAFDLPLRSYVTLEVFDVLGRRITELANGFVEAGSHSLTWNASNHPSGVYFSRFTASVGPGEWFTKTNKLILMK